MNFFMDLFTDIRRSRTAHSVFYRTSKRRTRKPLLVRFLRYSLILFLVFSVGSVFLLRWAPVPKSFHMLVDQYIHNQPLEYEWMPLVNMSPHVRLSVIAAEDQRFMTHHGLDFNSMQTTLHEYSVVGNTRGSSTITQQVANNMFLWEGEGTIHESLEGYYALLIDLLWSKQRILEVYLNITRFGPGVYGVEAASQSYFQHSSIRLSSMQAARLAAILPDPLFTPAEGSPYLEERTEWVFEQMQQIGGDNFLSKNHL
jgi:monofunctional biosynthetic peptidoglycan transglycosylase